MIYISSPFSHEIKTIEEARYRKVESYTVELMKGGHIAFSPIVYCYPMHKNHDLPGDFDFWQKFNIGMMQAASAMHIYMLPGWAESKGIKAEIDWWKRYNPHHLRNLHYIEPE